VLQQLGAEGGRSSGAAPGRNPFQEVDPPTGTFDPARDAAIALCDAIGAYADLIQLDRSRIARMKGVVLQVIDGVENLNGVGEPTTD
jgi:hypothetical protein